MAKSATKTNTVQPSLKSDAINAEFKMIPLEDILRDENQPRKFFDEGALNELVESVKSNGILQPIMVRPHGTRINIKSAKVPISIENPSGKIYNEEAGGPIYKLVCGERRFKAAEAAGLTLIPAVIRDMSEAEALEIQIIENLQRKDVNPMEEAIAFVKLKDRGFKFEEIAMRVGKSAIYVAQRMKLAELIDEFQELVYAGKMALIMATKVSRFTSEIQKELYKESHIPKDWKSKKGWSLESIWQLDNKGEDLSDASFDIKDPELYPEAGACNKCPHNSAANKLLFEDMKREKVCHNPGCFAIKTSRSYAKQIEVAMGDPEIVFVSLDSYPNKEEKAKIKAVQDNGGIVLEYDTVEVVKEPGPFEYNSADDYIKEQKEESAYSDFDTLEEKEQKELLAEWTEEFLGQKEEHEAEWKQYNEAMATGTIKKAFVVTRNWKAKEGEIVNIQLKVKKGARIEVGENASEDLKQIARDQEIAAINDREKRNKELDREKVYNLVMEAYKSTSESLVNDELHPEEWIALIVMITEYSYNAKDYLNYELGLSDSDYTRYKIYDRLSQHQNPMPLIQQTIRRALYDRLVKKTEADPKRYGSAGAMYAIAEVFLPHTVELHEVEQREKADKRIKNVEKRIAALKK